MTERLQQIVSILEELDEKEEVPSDLIKEYTGFFQSFSEEKNIIQLIQSVGDLCREQSLRDVLGTKEVIGKISGWTKEERLNTLSDFSFQVGRAFGNLSYEHPVNRVHIDEEGGTQWVLKEIQSTTDPKVKKVLCGALANLADQTEKIQSQAISLEKVMSDLIQTTKDASDIDLQKMAARALGNIVGQNPENINVIVKLGAIDVLLEIIVEHSKYEEIVVTEALNTLSLLTSLNEHGTKLASSEGIIKAFNLLLVPNLSNELTEAVTSFFTDFTENDEYTQVLSTNSEFMKKILSSLMETTEDIKKKNLSKILANISSQEKNMDALFSHFPVFIQYINSDDLNAKVAASTVIGNLARSDENCRRIMDSGLVEHLLKNLTHEDVRLRCVSLGSIRNLSLEASCKPKLLAQGVIPLLVDCLKHENDHVKYGSIGTIKILSNASPQVCTEFVEAGLFSALVPIASKTEDGHDARVQYEAARIIVIYASFRQFRFDLLQNGGLAGPIALVNSDYVVLQHEGAKCLSEFATYGQFHEEVLKSGVIGRLVQLAVSENKADPNNPTATFLNPPLYSLITLALISSTETCLDAIISEAVIELKERLVSTTDTTLQTELKQVPKLLERLDSVTTTKQQKWSGSQQNSDKQSEDQKSSSAEDESAEVLL